MDLSYQIVNWLNRTKVQFFHSDANKWARCHEVWSPGSSYRRSSLGDQWRGVLLIETIRVSNLRSTNSSLYSPGVTLSTNCRFINFIDSADPLFWNLRAHIWAQCPAFPLKNLYCNLSFLSFSLSLKRSLCRKKSIEKCKFQDEKQTDPSWTKAIILFLLTR